MDERKRKGKRNGMWLAKLHNYFKKHWFLYTLILALPSVWFTFILPYLGKKWGLETETGELSVYGFWITCAIALGVVAISFLNNIYLRKTEEGELEKLRGNAEYLSTIMASVDRICNEKCAKLENKIVEAKTTTHEKAEIISDPVNQLRRIVIGITECLVELLSNSETDFSFKDFFVTLVYNFPQENSEWRWLEGIPEKDMSLEVLLNEKSKSTFNHMLRTEQPYYFNNKKEDARKHGKYIYNPQDKISEEMKEIPGSIYCHRFRIIKGSKTYIDAMLSISTQKKRFSRDEKEACANVRNNMESLVKDSFGKRISIELCLLYLEYLKNHEVSS